MSGQAEGVGDDGLVAASGKVDTQTTVVEHFDVQSVAGASYFEPDARPRDAQVRIADPTQPRRQTGSQVQRLVQGISLETKQRLQQHECAASGPRLWAAANRVLGRR